MCDKIPYSYREACECLKSAHRCMVRDGRKYKHHKPDKIPKRKYPCKECGWWHLTSLKSVKINGFLVENQ